MSWLRRLWNTLRPERVQDEIARELSFHLAERKDQLRSEGLSEEESTRRARLQFGNMTVQAERTRDVDIARGMDSFLRNVRHGLRTLAWTPGFAAVAILTLALGIGANTAVFSAIDAVLLQPLPFPDSGRLMLLRQRQEKSAETNIAPIRLEDWNRLNITFQALTGYLTEDVSETSGDLPEKVRRARVAPRFLEVWGIAPALGRGFTDAEHRAGGPTAVLISDRYWRRRFGGAPDVLGRTVRMAGASFPIVGVMPASFLFPDRDVDLWLPVPIGDNLAQVRNAMWYTGVGRLRPGVTVEQGRANLTAVQAQLAAQYPKTDSTIGVEIVPLKDNTVGGVRSTLWLLFGAVSVLLLITCTNIASLLLSRAADRRQEIAIRMSLGATRRAVAAQMLTETAVLVLAGSAMGLLIAAIATAAFRSAGVDLPRIDEIALDGRILLYTLTSSVVVALLCGVLPAIRTARGDMAGELNEAGRTHVSTRNSSQWVLVGAQVALSVTLLTAAGLFVRSFYELSRVDPGFEPSRVLTFRMSGTWAELGDRERLIQRIDGTLEALHALPGVESAATGTLLPGVPAQYEENFEIVESRGDTEPSIVAESRFVSPEYFATLQIPLLAGEPCRRQPLRAARDVMVNQSLATRYLSGRSSVVGLHLMEEGDPSRPPSRIVGVVGDARERGLDREPGPTVYSCVSAPNPMPHFLVRTRGEPLAVAQAVRLKMKELEPLRSVYDIAPLEERIGDAFTENRLRTTVLVLFAATALSLACVGLYGTLSYVVSLRRREVGLRLALGARRSDILRQFLGQGLRVAGVACLCGLVLSLAFTRVLSNMLYGVSASDPVTLSSVIAIVLVVAGLAALVPATRAALVEPMRVLRGE
jgi:putative ABC transport system permease protein